jgi:hypothetical protein
MCHRGEHYIRTLFTREATQLGAKPWQSSKTANEASRAAIGGNFLTRHRKFSESADERVLG